MAVAHASFIGHYVGRLAWGGGWEKPRSGGVCSETALEELRAGAKEVRSLRELQGRGPLERGYRCLGDVNQQHVGEFLGQQTPPKGSGQGSYSHKALSYQWLTDAGCCFPGYAKQARSQWLKICLFGLF